MKLSSVVSIGPHSSFIYLLFILIICFIHSAGNPSILSYMCLKEGPDCVMLSVHLYGYYMATK